MSTEGSFRILSLDGGGIRGAFIAAFLAELERVLQRPIADSFDLIAGTSTGGIIAVAMALGVSNERVLEFYRTSGPSVFTRRPASRASFMRRLVRRFLNRYLAKHGLDVDAFQGTAYESTALRHALHDILGDQTLEAATTRLVIPAVDLVSGKPVVFKTPHLTDASTRDRAFTAVDVALATSAAPTFFPHATIHNGSAYCDGGLWATNPSMVGYAETVRISRCTNGPHLDSEKVQILSIGTGHPRYSVVPPGNDAGIAWWLPRIVDLTLWSQAEGTKFLASFVLDDRYHRVDFELPDNTWKLDSIEHIDQLIHLGREAAHAEIAKLRRVFFERTVMPFEPCKVA